MVKLDDVAKLAGVSKGTASRVLNNRGYISQQTRERIEAAVKELNYYPNENARNLLKRRSGMIGVVVPTITYPYYSEMISFLEKFLKASGYKILLCNTSFSSGASQDYIKLLNNNRVDGAIIFNYKLTEQDYASLSFPIVSIDRHIRDEASYVASDHVQGGTLAADCLLRCGCRHVIQIGGSAIRFSAISWQSTRWTAFPMSRSVTRTPSTITGRSSSAFCVSIRKRTAFSATIFVRQLC